MTFREQLAQTRNVGGVLRADGTYDSAALDSFNDGYGGGSICKIKLYLLRWDITDILIISVWRLFELNLDGSCHGFGHHC